MNDYEAYEDFLEDMNEEENILSIKCKLIIDQNSNVNDAILTLLKKEVDKYIKEKIMNSEQSFIEGIESTITETFCSPCEIRFLLEEQDIYNIVHTCLSQFSIYSKFMDEEYNSSIRLDQNILEIEVNMSIEHSGEQKRLEYDIWINETNYIDIFFYHFIENHCIVEKQINSFCESEDGFRSNGDVLIWKWCVDKEKCKKHLENNKMLFINNKDEVIEDFEKQYQLLVSTAANNDYDI
mgnify:CR=1 FL=1